MIAGTSVVGAPAHEQTSAHLLQGLVERPEMRHQLCPSECSATPEQHGVEDVERGDPIGAGSGRDPGRVVVQAQVPAEPYDRS